MTKRLILVMVSIVIATLLLAGLGTIVVGNLRARHTTETELRRQATELAANLEGGIGPDDDATNDGPAAVRRRLRSLNLFQEALDVDGLSILTLNEAGELVGDQIAGLDPSVLPIDALNEIRVVSGNRGNLVFAAAPLRLRGGQLVVVVLAREANSALRASLFTLFLAGLATLLIGIGAAVVLGRRLTKPIRDASSAATRIAQGELSTRLPEPPPNATDELAVLARSINQLASELERSTVLEQQFLLSVSHDLRTPLTSIRGYAEAISDGAADPQRSATVIKSEARRLERLVADLLDLAKLRAKSFSLRAEAVDLAALASVATEGFQPDAAERGLRLQLVGSPSVPVVADHDRLAQVVANLIENALKYARTEVAVLVLTDGRSAVLAVDDDGPGISPADRPHVFDRLYVSASRPVRRESSSGLGLAIVKELVEAMGGTVAAGESPSGGARLEVRLPS